MNFMFSNSPGGFREATRGRGGGKHISDLVYRFSMNVGMCVCVRVGVCVCVCLLGFKIKNKLQNSSGCTLLNLSNQIYFLLIIIINN